MYSALIRISRQTQVVSLVQHETWSPEWDVWYDWSMDYCMLFEYFNQTIWLNQLKGVWHFNFDLVHCVMFNEQVHEKH